MMEKTALISVFDKTGIVEFAQELKSLGWRLLASGGTARTIAGAGIPVDDVSTLVGGDAILGHRVVTLSREVHAGLLARDTSDDRAELDRLGIPRIDLVCVDLYPLESETSDPACTRESVIEKTDIGGPTILRSAAKGRRVVVSDPADRQAVIEWLKAGKPDEDDFVTGLVAKAEAVCGLYALHSAAYHGDGDVRSVTGSRVQSFSYGENPWQTPAEHYSVESEDPLAMERFRLIAGGKLSYNNMVDVDRLLQTATHIAAGFHANRGQVPAIAVGVKHGNPCGAAFSSRPAEAVELMVAGDPRAIFGGVVLVNFPLDEQAARTLRSHLVPNGSHRILDTVIAPSFTEGAISLLNRKGGRCRFLANPALSHLDDRSLDAASRFRYVRGGFIVQPNYTHVLDFDDPDIRVVGQRDEELEDDMLLAWAIGSTSNSNTITLVRRQQLIGNGMGQMDRVTAARHAVEKSIEANHATEGGVAYSDSFFPFTDGPEILAYAGVRAIITCSGSVRDDEVGGFCRERNVTVYMIPNAKARGFFGH
jgi:phosphoribosylaminoimidazolecarboxamide formyltransferase/IMP cyclohydrolase